MYVEPLLRTLEALAAPLLVGGALVKQHVMFADDLCGLALTPEALERDSRAIDEWCEYVKMTVRQSKGGILLPPSRPGRSMTVTLARWLGKIGQLCLRGDPYTVCGYGREASTGEASTGGAVGQVKYTKGPGTKGSNYGWFNVPYKHEFDAKQLVSQLFAKLEAKSVKIVDTCSIRSPKKAVHRTKHCRMHPVHSRCAAPTAA
jgi:hypothetical protein